jgi:hypothetical protein
MNIGQDLIAQFTHMVRAEGGALSLLGEDDQLIRVGYRMGKDPNCEDGSCVLPHLELEMLMNETLSGRTPAKKVAVQLIKDPA